MRIAYLTQSYPPMISGASMVAQQIAETMAARGHQVLVIAASDKKKPYVTKNDNLTILRLHSVHNPMRVGQRFLIFPYKTVMEALREFQPEMIHVHEAMQMSMLGIRYAKHARIPTALTIHQLPGFIASYLPDSLRAYAESILWMHTRQLAPKFTAIITPTQTVSTLMRTITGCKANTISYGLDLQTFRPVLRDDDEAALRQKWNLPLDVPLLLHVGRLDPDKHVDRVIQAVAQTMGENDAHLLIVGDGIQKSALMKLCESLGIEDRVHFTGYIEANEGLPEIYRIAYLFVSASEVETQGIVLLEAAASGLPIVAIRATCVPEIVHHGRNGLLAESADITGLSTAMNLLLRDREKAIRMGQASCTLAQGHEIQFTIEAHENLYHQLIPQKHVKLRASKSRKIHRWLKNLSTWMSLMR